MDIIKRQISVLLNVDQNNLNEIELEDIEFAPFAQQNINSVVDKIASPDYHVNHLIDQAIVKAGGIPCKGYWVDKTMDLVLFVSAGNESRAIVVPQNGWMIRDDIVVH